MQGFTFKCKFHHLPMSALTMKMFSKNPQAWFQGRSCVSHLISDKPPLTLGKGSVDSVRLCAE